MGDEVETKGVIPFSLPFRLSSLSEGPLSVTLSLSVVEAQRNLRPQPKTKNLGDTSSSDFY